MLVDVVEYRSKPRQFIRSADAVAQRGGVGDGCARATGSRIHDAEVLTAECRHENAAQRLTAAPFWSHAGAKCVRPTLRSDGAATLVAGTRPSVAVHLTRKRTNGSFVLEPMAMFVGPLATGVVAIEAWAARPAGDDELGCAPGARAVRRARMEDARHVNVLRRGCNKERACLFPRT